MTPRTADGVPYRPEELALMGLLRGRSSRNPIPMPTVAMVLGVSTRYVQTLVKHLIEWHHEPIGSTSRCGQAGYFEIHTPEDLARAEANLQSRALSCLRRLARLKRATPAEVLGQLSLALDQEAA